MPDLWTTFAPLLPYLSLAAALLPVMLVLDGQQRRRGAALFPPQRRRAVPWGGAEVLGAFLIGQFFPMLFFDLFHRTGVLDLLYGGERPAEELFRLRCGLWGFVAAVPFQIVAVWLMLRALSGPQPFQLGCTVHRLRDNILVGLLYWLVATPAVLLLLLLVSRLYGMLLDAPPDEHPIAKLMQEAGAPADWLLTVLSAVIAAPLFEEILYRGVLQPWLTRRAYRCDIVFGLSLLLAQLFRAADLAAAFAARNGWQVFLELHPALFVLLLLPVHLLLRPRHLRLSAAPFVADLEGREVPEEEGIQEATAVHGISVQTSGSLAAYSYRAPLPRFRRHESAACAIFNSALFFAVWHTGVWPTPIPLLLLGLVLGYLAWRTQSLAAPLVLHAVFNGVAVVTMFLGKV